MEREAFEKGLARASSWRKAEINNVKMSAHQYPEHLLRACYALVVAHWDGFYRDAICLAIEYLNRVHGSWSATPKHFVFARAKRICEITSIGGLLEFVQSEITGCRFTRMSPESIVGRGRDLRPEAIAALLFCLDAHVSQNLELLLGIIANKLIPTRNAIAHGERRMISEEEIVDACRHVDNAIDLLSDSLRSLP